MLLPEPYNVITSDLHHITHFSDSGLIINKKRNTWNYKLKKRIIFVLEIIAI